MPFWITASVSFAVPGKPPTLVKLFGTFWIFITFGKHLPRTEREKNITHWNQTYPNGRGAAAWTTVWTGFNSLGAVGTEKKGQSPSSRTSLIDWIKRVRWNIYWLQSKMMVDLCSLKLNSQWKTQDQWTARRGFHWKHLLATLWSPQ